MNSTVFTENLKKFRLAKNMTQEEVAEILCVNPQTVSRWECGTTLPDVMTLPTLARLYAVTVDDFYKKHSVAYENYAERLSAVYEKTNDPEDFIQCRSEYQKLMKEGSLSISDKWNYATIHHFMIRHCKKIALEWYDKAIAEGPESNLHIYRRARSLRTSLMVELGKGDEVIHAQKEACEASPNDLEEWICLVEAYIYAKKYEDAYDAFRQASEKFPENWVLYINGGEICASLKKYEEAFAYWDRAGELGTDFYDDLYSKAWCYNTLGEYQKAYDLYMDIASKLRETHYDEEAEMAETQAKEIKLKMK